MYARRMLTITLKNLIDASTDAAATAEQNAEIVEGNGKGKVGSFTVSLITMLLAEDRVESIG